MMKKNVNERDDFSMNYTSMSSESMSGSNTSNSCGCGCNQMSSAIPNCMPCCPTSPVCGCTCPPICECPQNQVCHRVINYEVPHIMPYHTTTVNHHVYNHTYTPVYSYSEVDEVENVYQNRCCR